MLTDENIENHIHQLIVSKEQADELLKSLRINPIVWNAAHIPEVLDLIIKAGISASLSELTLTALYERLAGFLIGQYETTVKSDVPIDIVKHDLNILAYQMLRQNLTVLDSVNQKICLANCHTDNFLMLSNNFHGMFLVHNTQYY